MADDEGQDPGLSEAALNDVVDAAIRAAAEDAAAVRRSLEAVSEGIEQDARPGDEVDVWLMGAAADRQALLCVFVQIAGEPDEGDDDAIRYQWSVDLPLYRGGYPDLDTEDESMERGIWVEFMIPWLEGHGVDTGFEPELGLRSNDYGITFRRSDWRPTRP